MDTTISTVLTLLAFGGMKAMDDPNETRGPHFMRKYTHAREALSKLDLNTLLGLLKDNAASESPDTLAAVQLALAIRQDRMDINNRPEPTICLLHNLVDSTPAYAHFDDEWLNKFAGDLATMENNELLNLHDICINRGTNRYLIECDIVNRAVAITRQNHPLQHDATPEFRMIYDWVSNKDPSIPIDTKWLQLSVYHFPMEANIDLAQMHQYCTEYAGNIYVIECDIANRVIAAKRDHLSKKEFLENRSPADFIWIHDWLDRDCLSSRMDKNWLVNKARLCSLEYRNHLPTLHGYCAEAGGQVFVVECDIIKRAMEIIPENNPTQLAGPREISDTPANFLMVHGWVQSASGQLYTDKEWLNSRAHDLATMANYNMAELRDFCAKHGRKYVVECNIIKRAMNSHASTSSINY